MESLEVLYKIQTETTDLDVYYACDDAIDAILHRNAIQTKLHNSITLPCHIGDTIYCIIGESIHSHVIDEIRIDENEMYVASDGVFYMVSKLGVYWFLNEDTAKNAFRLWRHKKNKGES